jgi:hypothetical protein
MRGPAVDLKIFPVECASPCITTPWGGRTTYIHTHRAQHKRTRRGCPASTSCGDHSIHGRHHQAPLVWGGWLACCSPWDYWGLRLCLLARAVHRSCTDVLIIHVVPSPGHMRRIAVPACTPTDGHTAYVGSSPRHRHVRRLLWTCWSSKASGVLGRAVRCCGCACLCTSNLHMTYLLPIRLSAVRPAHSDGHTTHGRQQPAPRA